MSFGYLPNPDLPATTPMERHWEAYEQNGGSIVAVAGEGFAVIASDTRLSVRYSILTRDQSKLFEMTKSTVLACTGCWHDVLALTRIIDVRMKMYRQEHLKDMSVDAFSQMLATVLYGRRFFPYWVSTAIAGLDSENKGVICSYDSVGHGEKSTFYAGGSSGGLLQPLLDNQVGHLNMAIKPEQPMSLEKAKQIIKDVFISAAERDIKTGDGVLMKIITKDGVQEETFKLRHD